MDDGNKEGLDAFYEWAKKRGGLNLSPGDGIEFYSGLTMLALEGWKAALSFDAPRKRIEAAAPDLLESVETLLDCFVNDPLGWMDSSDIAIEKAYDAIHKAKGE